MSNPFANWKLHDVEAHNQRVAKCVCISSASNEEQKMHTVEKESDLHSQIFNECRRRGWIAFHGSMSERTHRTLGEPDFTILANSGRVLMVECKARNGKLSLEQHAMIVHAEKLGHKIHVVWSFQEFLALL